MCGRYVLTANSQAIQQAFDLDLAPGTLKARYNIAPGQPVAVIANDAPGTLTFLRWGLIPSWAKDPAIGNRMINARAETLVEKPSFRHAYRRRRCLIPANGFYEWVKRGKDKVPMYIHLKDHALFAFAGLWETWQEPGGGEVRTCAIITTEPNELVAPLHHRMAVILRHEDYATWLSSDEVEAGELQPLLQPYAASDMVVYEVSALVNNVANDSPACIEPAAPNLEQQRLL